MSAWKHILEKAVARTVTGGSSFASKALPALVALALSPVVLAQQRPDAGSILQQQREPIEVPVRPAVAAPKAPAAPRAAPIQGSVKASGFRIVGNTVIGTERLLQSIAGFQGRTLAEAELRQLLLSIEEVYRGEGYFAAVAYYPEQQVKGGILEVAVVEGRLGRVVLDAKGLRNIRPGVAQGILGTLQSGSVLEESTLERRLFLLQDVNGMDSVTSELRPGRGVGEGDLFVSVTDAPSRVRLSVDADNGGSDATGKTRLGANARFNNVLGLGDQLGVRLIYQEEGLTQLGRLGYIVPVGHHGTKVGFGYSRVQYELGGNFTALGASGTADNYSVFATHPFVRARNLNIFGQAVYDIKDLRDEIRQASQTNEKRVSTARAGIYGDFRQGNGSVSTGALLFSSGTLDLRSDLERTQDQAGPQTNGSFSKINLDFQTVQFVGGTDSPFSVSAVVSAQKAGKNLTSAERLNFGGPNGVRAFPTGQLIADEGVLFQGELRYMPRAQFLRSEVLGATTLAVFYDAANANVCRDITACNRAGSTLPSSNRLQGAGVGVRMNRPGSHLLRIDLAWRTGGDTPVSGDGSGNPRLWIQFIKDLL